MLRRRRKSERDVLQRRGPTEGEHRPEALPQDGRPLGKQILKLKGLLRPGQQNVVAPRDIVACLQEIWLPEESAGQAGQHHHEQSTTHLGPIHDHPILIPRAPVVDIATYFLPEAHTEGTASFWEMQRQRRRNKQGTLCCHLTSPVADFAPRHWVHQIVSSLL